MKNKFLKYTGLGLIFRPRRTYRYFKEKITKSLRMQLILTFGVCTLASIMVTGLSTPIFDNWSRQAYITYENGTNRIDHITREISREFAGRELNPPQQTVEDLMKEYELERYPRTKIMIADPEGKVLYKTSNATSEKVDLHSIIQEAMYYQENPHIYARQEYFAYFPINVEGKSAYVVVSGLPDAQLRYSEDGSFFSAIAGFASFIALFYYMTKRKMRRIEAVSDGLLEISKGNLDYRVEENGNDELASLARNINFMAEELQTKIEEERRAEKTKNELITNVSHDLRTPLTSIMGYLRLLQDGKYEDENKLNEYVQIAFNKSEKLKSLIESLFEYTKITSVGHQLQRERVCLNEMLDQLIEEWVADAEESDVVLRQELPSERVNVYIDPNQMVRVFENLISNAIKYSHRPGEVRVAMNAEDASVTIVVANKGEPIPPEQLSRLFERFYKVEQSRTSASEGSGLGLAIAKSIVDLHGGEIWAESEEGQIRFLLKLKRI